MSDLEAPYDVHDLRDFSLPTELWEIVLDYATEIPEESNVLDWVGGAPKSDPLESGRLGLSFVSQAYHEYHRTQRLSQRQHTQNRLHLALVSRQWYHIMLPTLYRTIYIINYSQLKNIVQLIQKYESRAKFIRRVDLFVDEMYPKQRDSTILATTLFESAQNVIEYRGYVLGYSGSSKRPSQNSLSYREDYSLQVLYSNSSIGCVDPRVPLSQRLSSFRQLRALALPTTMAVDPSDGFKVFLPSLEVLSFECRGAVDAGLSHLIAQWELPRLHTVQVNLFTFQQNYLRSFWERYGWRIRTLSFRDKLHFPAERLAYHFPGLTSSVIPNLRQLIIYEQSHSEFYRDLSNFDSIASVEILEVRFRLSHTHPPNGVSDWEKIKDLKLKNILGNFTSIHWFRLVTWHLPNALHDEVEKLDRFLANYTIEVKKILQEHGIEFEAKHGGIAL